ncbi:MAG TPA: UPF0149 family protein [Opitutus sp.]|nr:UPF0149 family protein [Opitutus sp.]
MTRYEAYIEKDWREHGLAHVLVARFRENGSADYGVFLTDTWCLGVKDAFGESEVLEAELRDLIDERLPESLRTPIHPTCAKKLIEGAIVYAEQFGFAPHRDYRKARRVLSGIDSALCPTDFIYGRDGRPCYIRGPDDTEERVDRVLAVLAARCGADGFDYEDPSTDEADAIDQVRADLLDFLEAEPVDVPRFYALSGLLTAMLICPTALSPLKAFDAIWGEEDRVWESEEEAENFSQLLMAYWNYLNSLVQQAMASDAHPDEQILDVWEEDFEEREVAEDIRGLAMMAASFAWARGFRHATELWPDAWGDALARPDLAPHWQVVDWWADFDVKEKRDAMISAAEASTPRTLNPSVKALARALRPSAARP